MLQSHSHISTLHNIVLGMHYDAYLHYTEMVWSFSKTTVTVLLDIRNEFFQRPLLFALEQQLKPVTHTQCYTTRGQYHSSYTCQKKHFPLNNLPPKTAAAFQGLITNAGLMAAGMSYSYSSQKQTTSLYLYIWRHWNGGESRLNSCVSQFKTRN